MKGTIVSDALPGEQPTPSSAFDSTSVLATANKILGVDAPPLGDRMAWANTFAGLTELLTEPRKDCPITLPDLPPADPQAWLVQRQKPLNDHMIGQLLYFCNMMYSVDHENGICPGRPEIMHNQGLASDWIREHAAIFISSIRSGR